MTDPATGSLIIADRIPDGTLSYDLTLPDVECDNCTLQLIQMMTDKPPYTTDTGSNDIYYACVDLVLSGSAPDAGPGAPDAGDPFAGTDSCGGGPLTACCDAAGAAPGLLMGLALLGLRQRRRRSAAT